MIDPTYIELMNLELDGKASEKQRARLRCHLAESAEAASYFEDLARVVRGLDAEALLEPPSELHARIMTAVDQAAREPAPEGFAAWLARALRFTPARRRVLATFAVGVAAGAFLMASVRFDRAGGIDPSSVSGTMATRVPEAAIVPGPGSGVSGSAEIYTEEGVTVVDVRLEGAGVLEWTLGSIPIWRSARSRLRQARAISARPRVKFMSARPAGERAESSSRAVPNRRKPLS